MIETKVSLPALIDLALTSLGGSIYGCVLAFGWFHPTDQQNLKLGLLGAAIVLVVDKVTAYLAPHTSRPDLTPTTPTDPPAFALTPAGSVPLEHTGPARKPRGVPGAGQFDRPTRSSGD